MNSGFLVCSHEGCSYTVCDNCADLSVKNKAIVKAATKAYEWRDSTAFIGMIVVHLPRFASLKPFGAVPQFLWESVITCLSL